MATRRPRRTREQIEADKIIKKNLLELGEIVYEETKANSRVAVDTYYKTDRVQPKGSLNKAGGTLRDSINYMVRPDTILTMAQVYYGKYQQPDELLLSIDRHIDNTIDLVVQEIAIEATALILNINDN